MAMGASIDPLWLNPRTSLLQWGKRNVRNEAEAGTVFSAIRQTLRRYETSPFADKQPKLANHLDLSA